MMATAEDDQTPSLPPDKLAETTARRLLRRNDKLLNEVRCATSSFDALGMSPGERSRTTATYLGLRKTLYCHVQRATCWKMLAACAYTSISFLGGKPMQRRVRIRDVMHAFSLCDRKAFSKGMRLLVRARMIDRPIS